MLNRDLKLIFISNLAGSFGDGLFAYLLPVYMSDALGASPVEIGILYAVMILSAALTLLAGGMLADKYDPKKIMIAGWIAWLPVPLMFLFARNWFQMLPGMILWGVWFGQPSTTAYIMAAADKRRLTFTFTFVSSAWSVGYIFAPAIGGYLADANAMGIVFTMSFIFYAIASLVLVLVSRQYLPNKIQDSQKKLYSFSSLLRTRKLLALSIFFASMLFIVTMSRQFIPKFLNDVYKYDDFQIGILGSFSFLGSAVIGILLGRLGDKWRKSYALAISMILSSFSLTLLLIFGTLHILILVFFVIGGSYIVWSLMNAVVGGLAPEICRARWVSIPQTVTILGSFIAPYVGGLLYNVSPYYPFVVTIGAGLPMALLTFTRLFEE